MNMVLIVGGALLGMVLLVWAAMYSFRIQIERRIRRSTNKKG